MKKQPKTALELSLDSNYRQCEYCKKSQSLDGMVMVLGKWFCNKGHYRDYVQKERRGTIK